MLLSFIHPIFAYFAIVGSFLFLIGVFIPPKSSKVAIPSTDVNAEHATIKAKKVVEERVIIKVKCPYCGTLYDQTLDRCPYCGASR